MVGRNKKPVLTPQYCYETESLRLALEVLYGQRVCVYEFDFNTRHVTVFIGEEKKKLSYFFGREDMLHFSFSETGEFKEWYVAHFERPRQARVINESGNAHKRGPHSMWWVGRSATERWEEPLFGKEVAYAAECRGLTVEEYLNLDL